MNRARSLVKALTYRVLGTFVSMVGLWLVGGNLASVFAVGLGETFVKVFLFYFHERIWSRFDVTRKP